MSGKGRDAGRVLTLLLFGLGLAALSFSLAIAHFYQVDFYPINGDFQTFNAVRRLASDGLALRDYPLYLGLGPVSLLYPFYRLLGADFAASVYASHALHLLVFALMLLVLARLARLPVWAAGLVALAGLVLCQPLFLFLPTLPWPELPGWLRAVLKLGEPGNSTLGLRALLPFISAALLVLVFCSPLNGEARRLPWAAALTGLIAGLQPFWSNDYGLAGFLALLVVTPVMGLPALKGRYRANLAAFAGAVPLGFLLGGLVFLQGRFGDWFGQLAAVSGEQFWYFGTDPAAKVLRLADLPAPWLSLATLALAGLLFLARHLPLLRAEGDGEAHDFLLVYIAATCLAAGQASSIGGQIEAHYFLPLRLCLPFLALALLGRLLGSISVGREQPRWPRLERAMSVAALLCLLAAVTVVGQQALERREGLRALPRQAALGGDAGPWFLPALEQADGLARELAGLTPDRRVFSTYSTAFDLAAGAVQPSGYDYIIHALGGAARQHYLDSLHAANAPYATTIRATLSKWADWEWRVNWWFYREFLTLYEPVAEPGGESWYFRLWRRRAAPLEPALQPVACTVTQLAGNSAGLTLTWSPDAAEPAPGGYYFADIALTYQASRQPSPLPLIGQRLYLSALETSGDTWAGEKGALDPNGIPMRGIPYGLPADRGQWHLGALLRPGVSTRIRLAAYPEAETRLAVSACAARALAPADPAPERFILTPPDVDQGPWQNGIAVPGEGGYGAGYDEGAGFLVADAERLPDIGRRFSAIFAHGGKRRILRLDGPAVWVDGPPLDLEADGYPHPVIFTAEPAAGAVPPAHAPALTR
jgi:hypothetical protein